MEKSGMKQREYQKSATHQKSTGDIVHTDQGLLIADCGLSQKPHAAIHPINNQKSGINTLNHFWHFGQ
jgi:hypothetical protein